MGSKRKRSGKEGTAPAGDTTKRAKKDKSIAAPSKPSLEKAPFVETPTGDERRREAALYELLGSEDESDRLQAANCIVSSLLEGEGVSEATLERHLERRLFRGLASGRNASRLGFSLVITEIIGQLYGEKALVESKYDGMTFRKALSCLMDKTQAVGNIPGQEERDHFFGQLFGIECFVRSGVLFRDISRWNQILDLLLNLGYKKVWLRSQCGWVILQALGQMQEKDVEQTLTKLADGGLAKTPEGVAIWLSALQGFPKLKIKPWVDPLGNKSLGDLTAVLKESFQNQDQGQNGKGDMKKQASWSAQLHFVWDIILAYFTQQDSSDADRFESFWLRVVDDGLFSKSATDGQKFKGFMVFQKMLAGLVDQHLKLEVLFSKNFTLCLMNQAAKEDRYLHRAAMKALKAIESTMASNPAALPSVLKSLLGGNGSYVFDQRTNSKTIDRILQNVNPSNEKDCLKVIRQPISRLAQMEEPEGLATLRAHVDYLSKSLNAPPTAGKEDGVGSHNSSGLALKELARLAYTQPDNVPDNLLTDQIKDLCRSRLESSFAKLIRRSDDFSLFCNAVASIDASSVAMDEEIREVMGEALERMRKLLKRKAKTDAEKSLYEGLAMLHAVSIFQLYNEESDAMETLQDLAQYSDRLKKGNKNDDAAGSSELLVEILLSMVARPSSLMRQVSQQVFDAFTGQISAEGLALLTGPLSSSESAKGQQELFNTDDDAMDVDADENSDVEDVEEASDIELGSDVEFVGLSGDADGDSEDGEGEGEDEDEDEDGDDNEKREPIQIDDEALGNILRSHRLDKDADAESSADEADMSDSEMFALDEKLGEVFKNRANARPDSKKQKKDAKQSVVNFKHRILDLLDIYARNEALSPLAFSLLVPLLTLMRTTTMKPLASRACEIILNYQKGMRKARGAKGEAPVGENEDIGETVLPLLVDVHEEAGKDKSHAYAKAASAASLILASAMFAVDKESIKKIAAVYAKTQSDWVLGEARLQSSFFTEWNNWCQNQASQS